jgi:hypothetical protein
MAGREPSRSPRRQLPIIAGTGESGAFTCLQAMPGCPCRKRPVSFPCRIPWFFFSNRSSKNETECRKKGELSGSPADHEETENNSPDDNSRFTGRSRGRWRNADDSAPAGTPVTPRRAGKSPAGRAGRWRANDCRCGTDHSTPAGTPVGRRGTGESSAGRAGGRRTYNGRSGTDHPAPAGTAVSRRRAGE